MNGIKLSSQVVDSLYALVKTPSLSKLLVGSSGIGTVMICLAFKIEFLYCDKYIFFYLTILYKLF